jgi:hypothetical protein
MKNFNVFLMLMFMITATTVAHGADHRVRDKDKISRFNLLFKKAAARDELDEGRELLRLYADALVLDNLDEDKVTLGTNIHLVEEVNRYNNELYKDNLDVLYDIFGKRFQETYQEWSEERMWE